MRADAPASPFSQHPNETAASKKSTEALGSTAKDRRKLKRAAERASASTVAASPSTISSSSLVTTTAAVAPTVGGALPAGSTAKERRAAKRAAGAAAASCSLQTTTAGVAPTSGGAFPAGSTAKERQAAKRAAGAAAASSSPQTTIAVVAPTGGGPIPAGSTAKERRAAKRAADREAALRAAAAPAVHSAAGHKGSRASDAAVAIGTSEAEQASGNTAKERRMLRRQAERQKREREESGADGTADARANKRSKGAASRGPKTPHIVFVGQLAFSTTAKGLEEHFRTRGGVEGKVSVRLLTRKGTNPPRSKGMAFLEVEDAETAYKCLGLHHSRLDGRLLNVERTSGGGKGTKGARIKETRDEQMVFMKSVVQRVLKEFIDAGRLGEKELDEHAKLVLEKMEAKVMERAVKDYCDKPDRLELENPSAWFTHHAHKLCFRADPDDLDVSARDWLDGEKVKAAGRDRDRQRAAKKAGNGGGGRAGGTFARDDAGGGRGRGRGGGGRHAGEGRTGPRENDARSSTRHLGGGRGGARVSSSETVNPKPVVLKVEMRSTADVDGKEGRRRPAMEKAPNAAESDACRALTTGGGGFSFGGGGAGGGRYGGGGQVERKNAREGSGTSDLSSIFPSLRGRGGGRGGGMGGRGEGGRGFRQGGIHA